MSQKTAITEGDLFRYRLFDDTNASDRAVYAYGRVLDPVTAAFYSNRALPAMKPGEFPPIEAILGLDVAFVVGCAFDGFEDGRYEVIANAPLEPRFREPIRFYHRAVGEDICEVFDIWRPGESEELHISEVPAQVEQWAAYRHEHIERRLGYCRREDDHRLAGGNR